MSPRNKHRLIGATLLVAIGVVLLPMLLDGSGGDIGDRLDIVVPDMPDVAIAPMQDLDVLTPVPTVLPDSVVAPDASAAAQVQPDLSRTPAAWVVQVGSFESEANALSLRDQLRAQQYPAFVQHISTQYKVWVGPEIERAKAEQIKTRLAAGDAYPAMVLPYP